MPMPLVVFTRAGRLRPSSTALHDECASTAVRRPKTRVFRVNASKHTGQGVPLARAPRRRPHVVCGGVRPTTCSWHRAEPRVEDDPMPRLAPQRTKLAPAVRKRSV